MLRTVTQIEATSRAFVDCFRWTGVIEGFKLFELALDALGDLPRGLLDRSARPLGRNRHGLDGEGRVFLAAEAQIGKKSEQAEDDHEIPDHRGMIECPVGKVELLHDRALFSNFTFCPS
jgi:hypothetical protein